MLAHYVPLNGKQVFSYNMQQLDFIFRNPTITRLEVICHEILHNFGFPDLYRHAFNGHPVGSWDIMATSTANPQFPNSHSRLRYAGWGKPLEQITKTGNHTLYPIGSTSGTTAYAISTYNPNQFILLEYRSNSNGSGYDTYFGEDTEEYKYYKGLTITRINTDFRGNANPDGNTNDEVYYYRPGETAVNCVFRPWADRVRATSGHPFRRSPDICSGVIRTSTPE